MVMCNNDDDNHDIGVGAGVFGTGAALNSPREAI